MHAALCTTHPVKWRLLGAPPALGNASCMADQRPGPPHSLRTAGRQMPASGAVAAPVGVLAVDAAPLKLPQVPPLGSAGSVAAKVEGRGWGAATGRAKRGKPASVPSCTGHSSWRPAPSVCGGVVAAPAPALAPPPDVACWSTATALLAAFRSRVHDCALAGRPNRTSGAAGRANAMVLCAAHTCRAG